MLGRRGEALEYRSVQPLYILDDMGSQLSRDRQRSKAARTNGGCVRLVQKIWEDAMWRGSPLWSMADGNVPTRALKEKRE